jgi:choline-sulfatase
MNPSCRTFIAAAAMFFLVGWGRAPENESAEALCADCSVILVCFDTLRADRLGVLGYERPVTPRLDAFAKSSTLFSNAVSQSAWTLPSVMSVFTSLYPDQHGVVNKYAVFMEERKELARLPPSVVTLAELFRQNRYKTAAFTGGAALVPEHGFEDGFDVYVGSGTFEGFDKTLPAALGWLRENQDKNFFLFVHGYDIHGQYENLGDYESRFADPAYAGPYKGSRREFLDLRMRTIQGHPLNLAPADVRVWRDRYDEQVARADKRLGEFLESVAAVKGLAERTVIVVFADHGEQFHEHGGLDHGMTLYEEIIRVPLMIHVPRQPGRVVEDQVRLIDIMPTLARVTGLRTDPAVERQMRGVSLVPFLKGGEIELPDAFSSTDFLLHAFGRSVRTDAGWKLIADMMSQKKELYYLPDDPGEKNDLFEARPEKAYELEKKLDEWMKDQKPFTAGAER